MAQPAPLPLALVGIGKIARDQHLPAIAREPRFTLVAAASHAGTVDGIPNYPNVETLLRAHPEVAAVAIATPPRGRYRTAAAALAAGKHLMIEKPPGATLGDVEQLRAAATGCTLFAAWHSREAPAVSAAKGWLAGQRIRAVHVTWKENIRQWHPGQDWILEAGGFGVFDPAINALSILTLLLPEPLVLDAATLGVPANRQTPLTGELVFAPCAGAPVTMSLSFLQEGHQSWDICVETDTARLELRDGGAAAFVDGEPFASGPDQEYSRLYRRFAELIGAGASDVDAAPLRIVADAMLLGRRETIAPFSW